MVLITWINVNVNLNLKWNVNWLFCFDNIASKLNLFAIFSRFTNGSLISAKCFLNELWLIDENILNYRYSYWITDISFQNSQTTILATTFWLYFGRCFSIGLICNKYLEYTFVYQFFKINYWICSAVLKYCGCSWMINSMLCFCAYCYIFTHLTISSRTLCNTCHSLQHLQHFAIPPTLCNTCPVCNTCHIW